MISSWHIWWKLAKEYTKLTRFSFPYTNETKIKNISFTRLCSLWFIHKRSLSSTRRSSPVSSCCGSSQGRSSPCYVPSPTLAKVPLNFDEFSGCDETMSEKIDEACNNKSTVIKLQQPPSIQENYYQHDTLFKRRKTSSKRKRKTEEDFSRLGISSG